MPSDRFVSLWDMLEFNAERFVRVSNLLMSLQAGLSANINFDGHSFQISESAFKDLISLRDDLLLMEMPVSVAAFDRVLEEMKRPAPHFQADWLKGRIVNFSTVVGDELRAKTFLSLPSASAAIFGDPENKFGHVVLDAFPSIVPEVREAAKCQALERWTASVMHLMRALEVGLQAMARHYEVEPEQNWNAVLEQVQSKLKAISKKTDGKAEEQWASEVGTHFRFLKNAFRNQAMHPLARYDEEAAIEIFDSTKSFFRHLATRLSE
ncbi:hypothetical protein CHN51_04025 [Sphingorhabdus sp. YGSMI21]|nr:hypothetical protein CHN51_04025 [Sphingorhabdus sp. YGSMI21]